MGLCALLKMKKIIVIDEIQIASCSNTNEIARRNKRHRYKKADIAYPDPSARQRKTSAGGLTGDIENAGYHVKCRNTAPLVR